MKDTKEEFNRLRERVKIMNWKEKSLFLRKIKSYLEEKL